MQAQREGGHTHISVLGPVQRAFSGRCGPWTLPFRLVALKLQATLVMGEFVESTLGGNDLRDPKATFRKGPCSWRDGQCTLRDEKETLKQLINNTQASKEEKEIQVKPAF